MRRRFDEYWANAWFEDELERAQREGVLTPDWDPPDRLKAVRAGRNKPMTTPPSHYGAYWVGEEDDELKMPSWAREVVIAPKRIWFHDYHYDYDHYQECLYDHEDDPNRDEYCWPYMVTMGGIDRDTATALVRALFREVPLAQRGPRMDPERFARFASDMVDQIISEGSPDIEWVRSIPEAVLR